MSYAKLTPNCSAITPAITSNHKYILPTDPIYFKYYTRMMTYPEDNDPDMTTYISKNTLPTENIVEANTSDDVRSEGDNVKSEVSNQYNPSMSCKSCNK
jgi:hypothetical protein